MSRDEAAIKHTLDFILEQVYEDAEKYKRYFVIIQPKELKSKHGQYEPKESRILIYNLSRPHEHTLLTCLHELAHHIETVDTDQTAHEESFYFIFYSLLKQAIAYDYLSAEDIESEDDSSDLNHLIDYFGRPTSWKIEKRYFDGHIIFSIFTDPIHKSFLRSHGYKWYSLAQTWQKVCGTREEAKDEWRKLIAVIPKKDITTKNTGKVEFLAYYYLGILNGFDYRKALEAMGYVWEGFGVDKMWVKRVDAQRYYDEVKELTQFAGIEYKKVTADLEKERRRLEKKQKNNARRQKRIIVIGD